MRTVNHITSCVAVAMLWGIPADAQDQDSAQASEQQGDIIVTATRRETTLLETPAAVSVVTSDQLAKRGVVKMEDYLASVPGAAYQDRGPSANTITIRGIGFANQLDANTPTASYFGEVPITGLGLPLNGNQAGNADPAAVDLARVEVLRGPQGTLFGTGSLGGAVRMIPQAPNLTEVEGSAFGEYSNTARRGGNNYRGQGVINLPLVTDRLAVRLVGYYIHNDGYIDNVAGSRPTPALRTAIQTSGIGAVDQEHVGTDKTYGGRASLLWKPAEGLSVSLMQLYQKVEQDGRPEVDTLVSATDYLTARPLLGPPNGRFNEFAKSSLSISNLVLEYEWDWGSILNTASYIESRGSSAIDLSFLGAPFVGAYAGINTNVKRVKINELRFTSSWGGPLEIIAGGYYEDRKVRTGTLIACSSVTVPCALTNSPYTVNTQRQYAAFGEAALTPWAPFTLTVGARYYNFKQAVPFALTQRFPTEIVNTGAIRSAKVDGVNWKINAQFKASDEFFLYGQWAQGFREPRFQGIISPQTDIDFDADRDGLYEFRDGSERRPQAGLLDPDRVSTYEGGLKFQSSGGAVSGSLTGFYTNWTGIPVSILTTFAGAAYFFNAGKATSKGVEFELNGRLPGNMHAQFTASWVRARLGSDPASVSLSGRPNARLPGSPDHNMYAALEKRFEVGGNEAFIRGDVSYVGPYVSAINGGQEVGDYFMFGASGGVTINRIKIGVFAKNLNNRDNFTFVDNTLGSGRAYRLRPRTIGINAAFEF